MTGVSSLDQKRPVSDNCTELGPKDEVHAHFR